MTGTVNKERSRLMMKKVRNCMEKLARRPRIQRILQEELDLRSLKRRPTAREQCGIVLVLLSYVLGWPAVAFFGVLALYFKQPLILLVGGPLIYGFSHVVFFAGMYIAGKEYTKLFIKWFIKKIYEKLAAGTPAPPADAVKAE